MVFQFIKDTFLRKGKADIPQAHDGKNDRGIVTIGAPDSTVMLTQLELLRDAYRKHGDKLRAIIIGIPYNRVERMLASAGFDTVNKLHTLGGGHKELTFEDEKTAVVWTIAQSELDRAPKPDLHPGRRAPISEKYLFIDWVLNPATGMMRHRVTGKEAPRPTHLIYKGTSTPPAPGAYDGIHEGLPDEVIFERLCEFGKLGLNAQAFVRSVITVISFTRAEYTTGVFCELVLQNDSLMREVEFLMTNLESLSESDRARADKAVAVILDAQENIPPMALQLARNLVAELTQKRTPRPIEDFLQPGEIWHIPTDTQEEKHFACWLKYDYQQRVFLEQESDIVSLILVANWQDCPAPDFDLACLDRKDILQIYGILRADHFLTKLGEISLPLLKAFHARLWHASGHDCDLELLRSLYPEREHARDTLSSLNWESRLYEDGTGALAEAAVPLDVDGMEAYERARHAAMRH